MKTRFKPISQEALNQAYPQVRATDQGDQGITDPLCTRDFVLYQFLDSLVQSSPLRSGSPMIAGFFVYAILDKIYGPLNKTTGVAIQKFIARHQDIRVPNHLEAYIREAFKAINEEADTRAVRSQETKNSLLVIPSIGAIVDEVFNPFLREKTDEQRLESLYCMDGALATHDILFNQ